MSWGATLYDDRGGYEGDWTYTHNCNGMANAVLYPNYEQQSVLSELITPKVASWWKRLDGMNGEDGVKFLQEIIHGLESDPDRFRKMNPDNGWGNYDSFLKTLKEMRDSTPTDRPTIWRCSG